MPRHSSYFIYFTIQNLKQTSGKCWFVSTLTKLQLNGLKNISNYKAENPNFSRETYNLFGAQVPACCVCIVHGGPSLNSTKNWACIMKTNLNEHFLGELENNVKLHYFQCSKSAQTVSFYHFNAQNFFVLFRICQGNKLSKIFTNISSFFRLLA